MAWIEPARITERIVLRVLVLGFGLVVALLSMAGFVAVRSTRAIEDDAAQVGKEQLAMARLLNDVQAGQNTMAAVLHQLAPGQDNINRQALLRDLEAADKALANVASAAVQSPEAPRWRELEKAVVNFSRGVRAAIERGSALRAGELGPLFDLHDRVVKLEQELLESSEQRMETTEHRIENESRDLATNSRFLLGACLILAVLCALLTIAFARSAIRKIEAQASEISRVSWHMLEGQESMARRFSHELHDELGQSLAAVKANLSSGSVSDWAARRADCIGLVDQSIANVREISQLLHPVILDDFGLDAGLRWLTDGFSQRTGINTIYNSTFHERLNDQVETHLFRIVQEALTNVARHSGASLVRLDLNRFGSRLQMVIEDDGLGLTQGTAHRASLGMIGMRARAQEVGGVLRLTAPPQTGLRIEVEVPLPSGEERDDVKQENAHSVGG
jgi:signal transduction histidine kinase